MSSACVRVQVLHDESGRMWLMLHSGSRNIGNVTAQYYDKIAQEHLAQQGIKVPGGLNYLEIASEHGQGYLQVGLLTFDPVKCWLQGRTITHSSTGVNTTAAVYINGSGNHDCFDALIRLVCQCTKRFAR